MRVMQDSEWIMELRDLGICDSKPIMNGMTMWKDHYDSDQGVRAPGLAVLCCEVQCCLTLLVRLQPSNQASYDGMMSSSGSMISE